MAAQTRLIGSGRLGHHSEALRGHYDTPRDAVVALDFHGRYAGNLMQPWVVERI